MYASEHGSPELAIERWWPHLNIEAKHELLLNLDEPLSAVVVEQIERVCGRPLPATRTSLSVSEKDFIRTQIESVD
ncbi:hypothetical protein [Luethyella okanaganae]|uniref:Uncharacterized protein n=1 Tax=Luethyella okanaganae TaxID=69372 RepID=A0ABW1VJC7_9MICO